MNEPVNNCWACEAIRKSGGYECPECKRNVVEERDKYAKALQKAKFWEHHRDCKPLSQDGCRCGLWEAQNALDGSGE